MGKCDFLNKSIIAHRGIYNNITIYENTIDSILYAAHNNLTVEIDIRLTKDNEIIVFHDEDMTRLIKLKDKINTINYEDLNYISHYHIPTLKEVLDKVNNKVPIIIDIKEDNKILRNKLSNLLKKYNNILLQSYNYELIKYYKKQKYIVGLLINDKKNKNYLDKKIDVDFLSIKYDSVDKYTIYELKKDYYLIGWTLNDKEEVKEYIKIFNNLIIDNIEEVFS